MNRLPWTGARPQGGRPVREDVQSGAGDPAEEGQVRRRRVPKEIRREAGVRVCEERSHPLSALIGTPKITQIPSRFRKAMVATHPTMI